MLISGTCIRFIGLILGRASRTGASARLTHARGSFQYGDPAASVSGPPSRSPGFVAAADCRAWRPARDQTSSRCRAGARTDVSTKPSRALETHVRFYTVPYRATERPSFSERSGWQIRPATFDRSGTGRYRAASADDSVFRSTQNAALRSQAPAAVAFVASCPDQSGTRRATRQIGSRGRMGSSDPPRSRSSVISSRP